MRLHCVALLCAASVCAFGQAAKGIQADILSNFDDTQKKIVSLAEPFPRRRQLAARGRRAVDQRRPHAHRPSQLYDSGRI